MVDSTEATRAHNEAQQARRAAMLTNISELFGEYGAIVQPVGSHNSDRADLFSDLDVWVANTDDCHEEVLSARTDLYRQLGRCLFIWERPRFAPLDGIHSILFIGDEHSQIPLELNIFQASMSKTNELYRSFVYPTDGEWQYGMLSHLPWQEGEDSCEPDPKLHHLLLVAHWATKAIYRQGPIRDNLAWVQQRYEAARDHVPGLQALPAQHVGHHNVIQGILANIATASDCAELHEAIECLHYLSRLAVDAYQESASA